MRHNKNKQKNDHNEGLYMFHDMIIISFEATPELYAINGDSEVVSANGL